MALIRQLDQLGAQAWPAAEVAQLDGWHARFSDGVTRRANSVWPQVSGEEFPLDQKQDAVEAFYAARQLPARYQISPAAAPADLDQRLAQRGYRQLAVTAVQVCDLVTILRQTQPLRRFPEFEVEVAETFDDGWFAAFTAIEHVGDPDNEARRAILQRIAAATGYVQLRVAGETAAVGLGVLDGDWIGVYCLATRPAYRRRGAASAILRTLAIWAQLYDARHAYLQVMAENEAALALYGRAGFATLYHYHYREQGFGRQDTGIRH